jgi:dUTP pyrophosphatase
MMEILLRRLDRELPTPAYVRRGDAGLDLFSAVDLMLGPGQRALVPTGVAVAIPEGYAGFVQPRSGLALRHGVTVLNSPGLIDSGYRGEIGVVLVNLDHETVFSLSRGDRIAQLVIQQIERVSVREVDRLPESERGSGGFGSTGA